MNFRSVSDTSMLIQKNLEKFVDIDVVIGIPRSGMLPATIIATLLNKPLGSMDTLIRGETLSQGQTRRVDSNLESYNTLKPSDKILVVDDSIASGGSMNAAKNTIKNLNLGNKITFCAIYGSNSKRDVADIILENLSHPRVFEWNIMHHPQLSDCCIDIDGVLCRDPKDSENDDSVNYHEFIRNVSPRVVPKHKIGFLVTNRLEKYREETENWLHNNNFKYDQLYMLNLPSANSRRALGDYHSHKASVYKKTGACLFIESDHSQAELIANHSGKYVYSLDNNTMYAPNLSVQSTINSSKIFLRRVRFFLKNLLRK